LFCFEWVIYFYNFFFLKKKIVSLIKCRVPITAPEVGIAWIVFAKALAAAEFATIYGVRRAAVPAVLRAAPRARCACTTDRNTSAANVCH